MSTIRIAKFLEDDLRFVDVSLVPFLRKKLEGSDVLDFTGVNEVSAACLDALFEGWTPERVGEVVSGLLPAVDVALAEWAERRSAPVKPVERDRQRVKVHRPASTLAPPPIQRPPTGDERFTPTRLVQRLRKALRGYIESAYPLSDPALVHSRRILLDTEADGHLLAQQPYIETTTRYASSTSSYDTIGLPTHLASLFSRLARTPTESSTPDDTRNILYSTMYVHQERAFKSFLIEGNDLIVATGTGSGKTECFLIPMLGALYDEASNRPASFAKPGVRALVLYPMNALVNDQLSRLRLLFGEPEVATEFKKLGPGARFARFGMYTGRTAYPGPKTNKRDGERVEPLLNYYLGMKPELRDRLKRIGRYPAKDLTAFYAQHQVSQTVQKSGEKAGQMRRLPNWKERLHTGNDDRELLTRQEMVHGAGSRPGHSPDVLVTNYSMLEYMLMRPFERPIFAETRQWLEQDGAQLLLVLDEAHMYRGAKGAEVAFLIRRLRARLGIHEKPEKMRVIATSASLGSDEEARLNVKRFIADLTGKNPECFDAVTGSRETPEDAGATPTADADLLAGLNLDEISGAPNVGVLREHLFPLFERFGETRPSETGTEQELLAELHHVLAGRPFVNELIRAAATSALPLDDLADRVFPGHPSRARALEAVLTLGTLARLKPDEPGLIPTRVHAMFRGLQGLYACINPTCCGRQSQPGEVALLGKLFATPRPTCDACGARVFEIASCRSCGSPYILAWCERGGLDRLAFLWGETEGDLLKVHLLPGTPRYPERTEEIRAHLHTGYLDLSHTFPDAEVRALHLWIDGDHTRQPAFDRCVMCQPTAQSKGRIYDFRTRGEQPFTALIAAQFAEQPPQKWDPRLPNHGRKVLVFSDGRQKAARLTSALEHSHARDLFRQVVALGIEQLRIDTGSSGLQFVYAAVVCLCARHGYDLFPNAREVEFHNHVNQLKGKTIAQATALANKGWIRPTKSFAKALFSELTDRYYSLPALGLATVEEDPDLGFIFDDFPKVGMDPEAVRVMFRAWVRQHLERRSFRPDGAEFDELGEGWANPTGIDASQKGQLLPYRFDEWIAHVLNDDAPAIEAVFEWFQWLVRHSGLMHFEGDKYYLQLSGLCLNLRLDGRWFRCTDCGRIHPEVLGDRCPACLGKVVEADPEYLEARTGFYAEQVHRAFAANTLEPFGLSAEEHSAQLTGESEESAFNKVEEHELRFQDIPIDGLPPIDVLSCTTTMEVGIDIGALSGVALRNVPPHVANYQQRAGRAGRRGRSIASVITYAQGSSHDAHFFEHPADIISGAVRAPIVYVENQQVLERHVQAWLIQRFFHANVPPDPSSHDLFGSLGTVKQFLSDSGSCTLLALERWLDSSAMLVASELQGWAPAFSHGLQEPIGGVYQTLKEAIPRLKARLRAVLPIEEFERRADIDDVAKETLDLILEDPLLETLINHAVLPRYAFPTDVVSFWISKQKQAGDPPGKRKFDYQPQRDLQLALTEYAPGRSLTIDKWRFESAALFSPFEPTPGPTLERQRPYTWCRDCAWVSLEDTESLLALCPCCGSDLLSRSTFITPAGFAPDVNATRDPDRGEPIQYAGSTDRARLELQDPPGEWQTTMLDGRLRTWTGSRLLAVVNRGVGERGFRVCAECGRAEPEYGPGFTATKLTKSGSPTHHRDPQRKGRVCTNAASGPFFLGHRFPTDALLLRLRVASPMRLGAPGVTGLLSRAARMALTSLVEVIALAASRVLQIDEGELSGWWSPVLGGRADEAQLYLYDLLPGGAGYARAVGDNLDPVFAMAEQVLSECSCASSCYRCIRHYGNNWIHASLDRHLGLALLRHLRVAEVPTLTVERKRAALNPLRDYLRLRGIVANTDHIGASGPVPLVAFLPSGAVWIDVHDGLVDPKAAGSTVATDARSQFIESISLDAYDLAHDLPRAVERLRLPSGVIS